MSNAASVGRQVSASASSRSSPLGGEGELHARRVHRQHHPQADNTAVDVMMESEDVVYVPGHHAFDFAQLLKQKQKTLAAREARSRSSLPSTATPVMDTPLVSRSPRRQSSGDVLLTVAGLGSRPPTRNGTFRSLSGSTSPLPGPRRLSGNSGTRSRNGSVVSGDYVHPLARSGSVVEDDLREFQRLHLSRTGTKSSGSTVSGGGEVRRPATRASVRQEGLVYEGSVFGMTVSNRLRSALVDLVEHRYFEAFILVTIVVNCLFLAADQPGEDEESTRQRVLFVAELVFLAIFTLEAAVKILAMGFLTNGRHSYLRDPWNVLDFVVVVMGYVALAKVGNVSAVRSLRILRPLRTVNGIEGMRILVSSLFKSLPRMRDVFALFTFVFFIFGIIGMQLFGGKFRYRCYDIATGEPSSTLCSPSHDDFCEANQFCAELGVNPNRNVTGFDNIFQAWLTILQCISLEGWVDVMYWVIESTSRWGVVYFVVLILFGSLFMINLVTGVIFSAYMEGIREEEAAKEARQHEALVELMSIARVERMNKTGVHGTHVVALPSPAVERRRLIEARKRRRRMRRKARRKARQAKKRGQANTLETPPEMGRALSGGSSPPSSVPPSPLPRDSPEERDSASATSSPPLTFVVSDHKRAYSDVSSIPEQSPWLGPDGRCKAVYHASHYLAHAYWFRVSIVVLIVLNTLVLATEHYDQGDTWSLVLEISNYVFTTIFTFELVVKVIGLGWTPFVRDSFNVFDAVVVFLSIVEIILAQSVGVRSASLSAFRSLRLLRVLRLAKEWKQLQHLLSTIAMSVSQLAYFSLIMMLFIFIFALLGMQLFGANVTTADGERPRSNFDTFGWSLITVFQVIGGENWNEVMYDVVASTSWGGAIYFALLFSVGNYILLNLFLAILLANFDADAHAAHSAKQGREPAVLSDASGPSSNASGPSSSASATTTRGPSPLPRKPTKPAKPASATATPKANTLSVPETALDKLRSDDESAVPDTDDEALSASEGHPPVLRSFTGQPLSRQPTLIAIKHESKPGSAENLAGVSHGNDGEGFVASLKFDLQGRSLFLLPANSPLRQWLAQVVTHKWFEVGIFVLIAVSTLLLALEEPDLDSDSALGQFLFYADVVITAIFGLEMVLKILAMGMLFGRTAYLRSGWNQLDFWIVVFSIVNLVSGGAGFVKAFRALRALRPLRLVRRYESLRVVVTSIFYAMPNILNVLMVAMLMYLLFAILGVQLFAGLFFQCEDHDDNLVTMADGSPVDKAECEAGLGIWKNPSIASFDNTLLGIWTLFQLASMELWPNVMYRAVDIDGEGEGPRRDASPWNSVYFVAFIVFGNMFIMNLFVGVVVDAFTTMKEKLVGSAFLTPRQKVWLEVQRMLLLVRARPQVSPPPLPDTLEDDENLLRTARLSATAASCSCLAYCSPRHAAAFIRTRWSYVRWLCFRSCTHEYFEWAVACAILLNVVVMSMWYQDASDAYEDALFYVNLAFTIGFVVEAAWKLVGLGVSQYFASRWNVFDFVIVVGSVVSMVAYYAGTSTGSFNLTVLRVFRVARILRLVNRFQSLRDMVKTMQLSVPALVNVGSITLLIFFVYAVAGMALFGGLQHRQYLNIHANFDTFPMAMLTLFRVATGESWNGIMADAMRKPASECESDERCGSWGAVPYFFSFVVIGQFMMLNLFIAVVLEEFERMVTNSSAENPLPMTSEDVTEYADLWDQYTEQPPWWKFWAAREQWMPWYTFSSLLRDLQGGLALEADGKLNLRHIGALPIPLHERLYGVPVESDLGEGVTEIHFENRWCVHYAEGLLALCFAAIKRSVPPNPDASSSSKRPVARMPTSNGFGVLGHHDDSEYSDDEVTGIPPNNERLKIIRAQMSRKYPTLVEAHTDGNTRQCHYAEAVAATTLQASWRGVLDRRRLRAIIQQRRAAMDRGSSAEDSGDGEVELPRML